MITTTVYGNLTADSELMDLSGSKLLKFTVASNNKPKGKKTDTGATFITCHIWGERGENLSKYLLKGKPVIVVGELESRNWQTETSKGTALELRVDVVEFVSTGQSTSESKPATKPTSARVTAPASRDLPEVELDDITV